MQILIKNGKVWTLLVFTTQSRCPMSPPSLLISEFRIHFTTSFDTFWKLSIFISFKLINSLFQREGSLFEYYIFIIYKPAFFSLLVLIFRRRIVVDQSITRVFLIFEPTSVGRIFGWGRLGREGSAMGAFGARGKGCKQAELQWVLGKLSVEAIRGWGKGSGSLFSVYTIRKKYLITFCSYYQKKFHYTKDVKNTFTLMRVTLG